MPLPDLDILVAVLDGGSLTAAAESLGLPRATLSRRLSRLEEEIGAELVHRTSRNVSATPAGDALYRHARPIVAAVAAAADAVRAEDGVPRGLLRVTVPAATGAFSDLFTTFLQACPQVRLEVVGTTRHVDLAAEGFDVGLRAGTLRGAGLLSRKLYTVPSIAVASRGYLERRGRPASPDDLLSHDCLVGFERGEVPRRQWPLRSGGAVPVGVRYASNDLQFLHGAARAGVGIAMLPRMFVDDGLASGALEAVLPDVLGPPHDGGLWLVFPEQRFVLPRVRAFLDHAVAWAAAHPMADWTAR